MKADSFFYDENLKMKAIPLRDATIAVEPIYATTVKDENTLLVFLHEALGSISQWKSFPQDICNALQLNGIVYEREGYGNSSPLKSTRDEHYLHDYALKELPELLEIVLSPDKQIILIGHSDGGTIALLYAAKFPNKVKAIVSMAAHVIVEEETLAGIQPAIDAFQAGKLDGLKRFHGDKTQDLFDAWANTWNLPAFRTWNICKDIHAVIAPTLILQGKNDQYGTEKQVQLIAESIAGKSKSVIVDQCGHIPHLEQGTKVISEIKTWYTTI